MTPEEIDALPENGGWDAVTDTTTGYTSQVRRPIQFLVRVGSVLFYTMPDGTRWSVGKDTTGKLWKERWPA